MAQRGVSSPIGLTLRPPSPHTGSEGPQGGEREERPPPELPLLSEQLCLDELWDMLGECLKELEESHDQHAVLGEGLEGLGGGPGWWERMGGGFKGGSGGSEVD